MSVGHFLQDIFKTAAGGLKFIQTSTEVEVFVEVPEAESCWLMVESQKWKAFGLRCLNWNVRLNGFVWQRAVQGQKGPKGRQGLGRVRGRRWIGSFGRRWMALRRGRLKAEL